MICSFVRHFKSLFLIYFTGIRKTTSLLQS